MSNKFIPLAAGLLLIVTACGGARPGADVPPLPPPSTATPTATTPPPTPTPILTPTPTQVVVTEAAALTSPEPTLPPTGTFTPEPTPTPSPEPDWLVSVGRTEEGLMFLGNPEAPVTIIDYSDFL
jgi:hypothetical protein